MFQELNKLSDDLKKSKEVMLEQLDSKEKNHQGKWRGYTNYNNLFRWYLKRLFI